MTKLKGSKKYRANLEKIQAAYGEKTTLTVEEAVNTLVSLEQPNYKNGASVEIHFNLNIDPTKSDQLVRSSVSLPHGTGKEVKIAAFVGDDKIEEAKKAGATLAGSDDLVAEIKKNGSIDFDVAVAQASIMRKVAPIARILGVAGVMPNPKSGTVGDNITEMITELVKGKVNYKNDKTGNLHFTVGKINKKFDEAKLIENVTAAIESVEKTKPDAVKRKFIASVYVTSTLSPSIKIEL